MDDEIKHAEARGYAKGYAAGRKRKQREIRHEVSERERRAFIDRAFLAALPAAIVAQGWSFCSGEPITNQDDRIKFAWGIAHEAERQRY